MLDPEKLIDYLVEVGKRTGLTSRVNYDLACWYASKAAGLPDSTKHHPDRRTVDLMAVRRLELADASGTRTKTWEGRPSLRGLRENRVAEIKAEFWKLVGEAGIPPGQSPSQRQRRISTTSPSSTR